VSYCPCRGTWSACSCADLADGGAAHIASTISKIKQKAPSILVEALTPDFANKGVEAVHQVASSGLDVFAHNVETVERCTPFVRDRRANFAQSLKVLEEAKKGARAAGKEILTKTSLMLGVGEQGHELEEALRRESPRVIIAMSLTCRSASIRRRRRHFRAVHATDETTHEGRPLRRAGGVRPLEARGRRPRLLVCRQWPARPI